MSESRSQVWTGTSHVFALGLVLKHLSCSQMNVCLSGGAVTDTMRWLTFFVQHVDDSTVLLIIQHLKSDSFPDVTN